MKWRRVSVLVVVLALSAQPLRAGIIFNRKPKAPANDRVPTLLYTLKSDPTERKRADAADELGNFDGGMNPEIIPALIEAVLKDPQPSVRIQAVQSLGKIRPVSQQAGRAIEQAASSDPTLRVQLQARNALIQYRMGGYQSQPGQPAPTVPTRTIRTDEPPLADPPRPPAPMPTVTPTAVPRPAAPAGSVPAPPPRPLPEGPALTPTSAALPLPREAVRPPEDGPELNAPK